MIECFGDCSPGCTYQDENGTCLIGAVKYEPNKPEVPEVEPEEETAE